MTEAEIQFPVQCPVCAAEAMVGFRISVVADALRTGELRLYAACHIVSWEASEKEIFSLHEYLESRPDDSRDASDAGIIIRMANQPPRRECDATRQTRSLGGDR